MHEAKLAKMEAEMKMVFQQKVQEKEAKLKQSEEELYARHREMKEALEKQRMDLEDKKRRIESGRPLTPEKTNVSFLCVSSPVPLSYPGVISRRERRVSSVVLDCHFFLPSLLASLCLVRFLVTLWYPSVEAGALPPFRPAIVHLRAQ